MKLSPLLALALAGAADAFTGTLTANPPAKGSKGMITQNFLLHDDFTGSVYSGNADVTNGCSKGCSLSMQEIQGNDLTFRINVEIFKYSDGRFQLDFHGQLDAEKSIVCSKSPCEITARHS